MLTFQGDIDEEMNDNIDLSLKSVKEKELTDDSNSDIEFEDAQNSPEKSLSNLPAETCDAQNSSQKSLSDPEKPQTYPPLRRSNRQRKPTSDWWKASGMLAFALALQEPTSYKVATSPDDITFWQPGIDREHNCLTRNRT